MKAAGKSKIAVALTSGPSAKAILSDGLLSQLAKQHTVLAIKTPELDVALDPDIETVVIAGPLGPIKQRLNFHIWNASLFASLRRQKMDPDSSFKVRQLPHGHRKLYTLLSNPMIHPLLTALDRSVVFRTNKSLEKILLANEVDLVLVPGSAMDAHSFQFTRAASSIGIPSAMIVTHWDYFTKKGLLREVPNKVYVWGDDMHASATRSRTTVPEQLEIVGAPQFDRYRRTEPKAAQDLRNKLGVAKDEILLLFAGTSAPFDEETVVAELEAYIKRSGLSGIRIAYRRHPRAWSRRSKANLRETAGDWLIFDDSKHTSPEHFVALLSASDGIISPFSTMIIEAALCGKPSLCIGFDDEINGWDFSLAASNEHIQQVRDRSWVNVCDNRAQLATDFEQFIERVKSSDPEVIRADVRQTVFFDELSYSDRLMAQLEEDFDLHLLRSNQSSGCTRAG